MPVSDVCTGYWAFNDKILDYIREVGLDCSGFEMEAELFAKISKCKFKIAEIPISYKTRKDKPKLNSFSDGFKIFKTLLRHKLHPEEIRILIICIGENMKIKYKVNEIHNLL